jgi:hypothetical protein
MLINSSIVDELYCSGVGAEVDGFRYIRDDCQGSGRWQSHHWMILEEIASNDFYAIEYSEGLTENQDHDFPWRSEYGDDPETVEAFRVYPKAVISVKYRKAPDGD